jgi:hypothetical protein
MPFRLQRIHLPINNNLIPEEVKKEESLSQAGGGNNSTTYCCVFYNIVQSLLPTENPQTPVDNYTNRNGKKIQFKPSNPPAEEQPQPTPTIVTKELEPILH